MSLASSKARYQLASGGLSDWEAFPSPSFFLEIPSQILQCLWLCLLSQGTPAYPAPAGGISSLHPDLMMVAFVSPVAHAVVARGQRRWRLQCGVVAINEHGGVLVVSRNHIASQRT
jgi:hypothetical protein